MIGKVYKKQGGAGGGEIINGIIEQYKASTSDISANSFVEFVTTVSKGNDIQLSTKLGGISATAIDDNKVFVTHKNSTTGSFPVSDGLFGMVCTINGTTITTGTDTQLVGGNYAGMWAYAITIDTNKVFVICTDGSNYRLGGTVCTISGTTISTSGLTSIYSSNSSIQGASATKIDANKVYVSTNTGYSSYYLMGIICTISGTSITVGSATTISSNKESGNVTSTTTIDTNKVFIAYPYETSYDTLGGVVCTVSGTTITKGSNTQLSTITNSGITNAQMLPERIVTLDTNKVFIAHSGSNYELCGIVCTVSGTTITKGTDTQLYSNTQSVYSIQISAEKIGNDKVFVTHSNQAGSGSQQKLNGLLCNVSGTTITIDSDTSLTTGVCSANYNSSTVLENKIFIVHQSDSTNKYLNGIVVDLTPTIKLSTSKIDGITKDEITTSTAGDVWVLNQ